MVYKRNDECMNGYGTDVHVLVEMGWCVSKDKGIDAGRGL